jgi:hypothetical protein
MGNYRDMGTFSGGTVNYEPGSSTSFSLSSMKRAFNDSTTLNRFTDGAIATAGAFLVSELEKRDPIVRVPLTSFTYARDIPIKTGGGWVDHTSNLNIDYGVTGGAGDGTVQAGGANGSPLIQMNLEKDTYKTHVFNTTMRIKFVDMMRSQVTGRSLDKMLSDGVRMVYDKHMDQNVYKGLATYGSYGLVNNPNITAATAAYDSTNTYTDWAHKTPQEILKDINDAINAVWEAAGYDLRAMPNHILLPHEQFNYIATQPVSGLSEKSILTYLQENNVAAKNNVQLVIAGVPWCKGAGTGTTDRMVVYVHDELFVAVEELAPLSRVMTSPSTEAQAYDSLYMANLSEVEFFYTQTVRYVDGI